MMRFAVALPDHCRGLETLAKTIADERAVLKSLTTEQMWVHSDIGITWVCYLCFLDSIQNIIFYSYTSCASRFQPHCYNAYIFPQEMDYPTPNKQIYFRIIILVDSCPVCYSYMCIYKLKRSLCVVHTNLHLLHILLTHLKLC